MKGGIGTASFTVDGVTVGALVACNALGDVYHPHTGQLLAGARTADGQQLLGARDALLRGELTEKQQLDRACRALEDGRKAASASGRALAQWKMRKPALECQVDHWRHQLQLTLGLELV